MDFSALWKQKRIDNKVKIAGKGNHPVDEGARGSGPPNRDGRPKLPVGQHEVKNWPVLDLGVHPEIPQAEWRLEVDGEVEDPQIFTWDRFMALPQTEDISDFHCVTTWSRFDIPWVGVKFGQVMEVCRPRPSATHVVISAYDGYTTNLSLADAMAYDVLIVHTAMGAPLTKEHGGPVRMITPQLYAWKGAKWIKKITLLSHDQPGFWEVRGYSNTARPWKNDRYS